jgi:hypothetical protein
MGEVELTQLKVHIRRLAFKGADHRGHAARGPVGETGTNSHLELTSGPC